MACALIALGSNLGDREQTLEQAATAIAQLGQSRLIAKSPWLESSPVGGPPGQRPFLNGAILVETSQKPLELLDRLFSIEDAAGRRREVHWGPRTLDLDLLLYGERVIHHPRLTLPHPRMIYRRFVLQPAAQIAPSMLHPTAHRTINELLENLAATPPYLALLGPPGSGKTRLVRQLARRAECQLLLDPVDNCSTGLALAREIELVTRRARELGRWAEWSGETWTVSDFWLPQSLAWAEAVGDDASRLEVEDALRQFRDVPTARFVAAVAVPVSTLAPPRGTAAVAFQERLREAMRRLAAELGQPPVVWLDGGGEASVSELLAVLSG